MITYGGVKSISAARTGSMARKAMSQRPSLSAANTSPAALNSTSSTGTPSRLPSSLASMMVTPLGSETSACFCTRTLLPWLMAARSLPVGAKALTISGVTWLTGLPLSDGVGWANAAAGTASATIAAAKVLRVDMNMSSLPCR